MLDSFQPMSAYVLLALLPSKERLQTASSLCRGGILMNIKHDQAIQQRTRNISQSKLDFKDQTLLLPYKEVRCTIRPPYQAVYPVFVGLLNLRRISQATSDTLAGTVQSNQAMRMKVEPQPRHFEPALQYLQRPGEDLSGNKARFPWPCQHLKWSQWNNMELMERIVGKHQENKCIRLVYSSISCFPFYTPAW